MNNLEIVNNDEPVDESNKTKPVAVKLNPYVDLNIIPIGATAIYQSQKDEFGEWRNKIGDLMLLPNGSNQSYGDLPYKDKVKHYIKENVLAKSLCDDSYKNNPNFMNFVKKNSLPFKPHAEFKKQDILDRVNLYRELSKMIWGDI